MLRYILKTLDTRPPNIETKDSTRKTEEKLDGKCKEGHERKKPKCRPLGR
jgi:hypothetical protein